MIFLHIFIVEAAKLYPTSPFTNTFCVVKANNVTLSKTSVFENTRDPQYKHTTTL